MERGGCWKRILKEKRCLGVKQNPEAFIVLYLKCYIIHLSKYINSTTITDKIV